MIEQDEKFVRQLDAAVLKKSMALEAEKMKVAKFVIHFKGKFTICELNYDGAMYFGLAVKHLKDKSNEQLAVATAFQRAYAEADGAIIERRLRLGVVKMIKSGRISCPRTFEM